MELKKDFRVILRVLAITALLYTLYLNGTSFEVLAILGIFFIALIFLRGKIWKLAEHILEKHLPFTKKWPDWAEKVFLVLVFILLYIILKNVIFFILGLAGIDIEQILLDSFTAIAEQ